MKRWHVFLFFIMVASVLSIGGSKGSQGAAASPSSAASVQVTVSFQVGPTTAGALEKHVTGGTTAKIDIPGASLTATTDGSGHAQISNIPLAGDLSGGPAISDVVITAPGYAPFTYLSVPLDGSITLTPILGPEPRTDDLGRLSASPAGGPPTATATAAPTAMPSATPSASSTDSGTPAATPTTGAVSPVASPGSSTEGATDVADGVCDPVANPQGCWCDSQSHWDHTGSVDGWTSTVDPGNTISIYYNYSKAGESLPTCMVYQWTFKDYVKEVLPNEWGSGWLTEAYRAGAVAVKMFGWERELYWYNISPSGQPYAVDASTNFQVWDPLIGWDPYYQSTPTSEAVNDTWQYRLMRADGVFPYVYETSFLAGYASDSCDPSLDHPQLYGAEAPGDKMSQWGSENCAEIGWSWLHILAAYYWNPVGTIQRAVTPSAACNGWRPMPGWASASNPADDPRRNACGIDPHPTYQNCTDRTISPDGIPACVKHLYSLCASIGDASVDYSRCPAPSGGDWNNFDSDGDGCPDWVEMFDMNGDKQVGATDLYLVAIRVGGQVSPNDLRDAVLDTNHDGIIGSTDLYLVAVNGTYYRGWLGTCGRNS